MRSVSWLFAAVLLVSGCGAATPPELTASATAQRADEGKPLLSVALRNEGVSDVAVQRVRLSWDGMDGEWVRLNRAIRGDDAVAFKAPYDEGVCESLGDAPTLTVEWSDGTEQVPLVVRPDSLLQQIHDRQCSLAALASQAEVSLADGAIEGASYRTEIVIDRVAGSTEPLEVVDVGGSVLLRLAAELPVTVRESTRIPLIISPTPRCDPHAQSQSSQTFLLSAYLKVGGGDVRAILPLSAAVKADLQQLISRFCR